jgi:REP element-mobilizing transposase RayT
MENELVRHYPYLKKPLPSLAPKGHFNVSPGQRPGKLNPVLMKALKGARQLMPQSLARLHTHLIFSTKNRERILGEAVRDSLHRYMATVLQNLGCPPVLINSVADHVHILFELGRTVSVSHVVEEIKTTSSKWIKTQGDEYTTFAWQAGYGAFAVSESNVASVREYIADQSEHHRAKSFQEEYRAFLEKHRVAFDEKYVWD